MTRRQRPGPAHGFSLMELIIVVAITLVVAAIAIPRAITAAQDYKLRSTASSVSGVIQKCRMLAVARNALCPTGSTTCSQTGYYAVVNVASGGNNYVFVDMDGSKTNNTSLENTSVLVPTNIVFDETGGPSMPSTTLGYSTAPYTSPYVAAFNARGLPCIIQASGACTVTGQGYIYYFRLDRSVGGTAWAVVTVSPAGRAQVWSWDGANWEQ